MGITSGSAADRMNAVCILMQCYIDRVGVPKGHFSTFSLHSCFKSITLYSSELIAVIHNEMFHTPILNNTDHPTMLS